MGGRARARYLHTYIVRRKTIPQVRGEEVHGGRERKVEARVPRDTNRKTSINDDPFSPPRVWTKDEQASREKR